jgi:hypothetical protein
MKYLFLGKAILCYASLILTFHTIPIYISLLFLAGGFIYSLIYFW